MSKITKFVDMMMNFPNRFRVDGIQKTIVEDWDITQQGTKNKAEYFNEIEKQTTFDCLTNRVIDGSKEVYEMDLEGYPEFGEYELKFRAFFQTTNTTTDCYVRFYAVGGGSFIEYPIRFYKGNVLTAPSIGTLAQKKFINFKILEIGGIKYAVINFPVLDITSTTDGITVANGKDLTLNTVDNLTTPSATKPLSANMGKNLQDTKEKKVYRTVQELGLVPPVTCLQIVNATPASSRTIIVEGGSGAIISDAPGEYGIIVIDKANNIEYTAIDYYEAHGIKRYTAQHPNTSTLYWDRYITEKTSPVPIGGILTMADNTSPADKYPGTTWSIIADDKVLRGGNQSTVNATGGSNTKTIAVGNLPAHTFTRGTMNITGAFFTPAAENGTTGISGFSGAHYDAGRGGSFGGFQYGSLQEGYGVAFDASRAWTGASSSVGSGTELDVTNAYAKLVFWKRLS